MKNKYKNIFTKEFLIEQHFNLKKTWTTIAKEIGCNIDNIKYYFKKYGLKSIINKNLNNIITKEFLIEEHFNSKKTFEIIAKEIGCSVATINNYFRKYGLKSIISNKNKLNKVLITKEFLELQISLGKNKITIANEIGCNPHTITEHFKKHGLKIRYKSKGLDKILTKDFLYEQYFVLKKSIDVIAKEIGCGRQAVLNYFINHRFKCDNHYKHNGCSYKEIPSVFFCEIRKGARTRNLEFNITIEEIWELYLKQNKKCKYTNVDLYFQINKNKSKNIKKILGNASLDRTDSKKGYTIDNIQLIHKSINCIKNDMTEEELFYWCKKISLYDGQQHKNGFVDYSTCKKFKHKGWGEISGIKWLRVKNNSIRNKRKIKFKITIGQIWELFLKQNRRCALTGELLTFGNKNEEATASLDRIDSSLDYTIDNVQWTNRRVNMMKLDYNQNEFIDLCKKIYSNANLS